MSSKDEIIAEFRLTIERLKNHVQELELELARAKRDSSNSSKSPSSDIVKPPAGACGKHIKAKYGGQEGHKKAQRQLLPPERVDKQITYEINDAEVCEFGLTPTNGFDIVQHVELLDMPIYVTEYRLRKHVNRDGQTFLPHVAQLKNQPIFSPRLLAVIGLLKSRVHCSDSTIETWMNDVLQVPVSRGYLSKLRAGIISASLADMHEQLKQAILREAQLGSDESSLKNNGKKHWIWCITALLFTVFHIAAHRSRSVLEELIGTDCKGAVHFDYFSASCSFAWNFDIKAQYCSAHLVRDIRFLLKHPHSPTTAWAGQLLDRSRRMFSAWHRRDEMTGAGFHRLMMTHCNRFLDIVLKPPDSQEAANLAAHFQMIELDDGSYYDMSQDCFRFMFEPGVEPTNNHAEQQVRHCVSDRRITQGARGIAGQCYHERMWTAIATCGKQGRSFFHFLHQSISAHLTGQVTPTLLSD